MWHARFVSRGLGCFVFTAAITLAALPAQAVPDGDGAAGTRVAVPASSSVPKVPGLTASLVAQMGRQERAGRIVDQIRAAAGSDVSSGIAGIRGDGTGAGLRLYWHGPVPASVTKVIDAARADGVPVTVTSAPYTEESLVAEAERLSRLPLFAGARSGQRALRVHPKPDGSGLAVGIAGLPDGVDLATARRTVPALDSAVPLTVEQIPLPALATRFFDSWPYYGGALMMRPAGGNACTSGFGVTGNNGAATYLMTAAHCGEGAWQTGTVTYPDGSTLTRQFGTTIPAGRSTGRDVELVHTPQGAGGGVYWGTPINPPAGDPGSNSYVRVTGDAANVPDNRVCASGSFSGTQCGALILATNVNITIDPPFNGVGRITNLVWAQNLPSNDSSAFVGQGDSGGPITSLASGGGVRAQGIISAIETGNQLRPCKGYNPPGRECSFSFFYADLRGAMSAVSVRINTE